MSTLVIISLAIGGGALCFSLGAAIAALFLTMHIANDETWGDASQAADADAAADLDYLERSECNLYFNPTISAWGLLDGKDELVSAGHSVRAALQRARNKGRDERDEVEFMSAEIKKAATA